MKVLIENYKLEKKQYSQFYSEITFLSLEEIKDFLKEIPPFDTGKQSFKDKILNILKDTEIFRSFRNKPIRIITEKYIIVKKDNSSIFLLRNHQFYENSVVVDIEDIGLYFKGKSIKFDKYKKFFINFLYVLTLIFGFSMISTLPIFNLFMISVNFTTLLQDLTIFIFFSILFGLSSIDVIFSIKEIVFKLKNHKKKPLKLSIPYLDAIKKKDISRLVANFVQCLYLVIFDYFEIITFKELITVLYFNEPSVLSILYVFVLIFTILNLTFTPIIFIYRLIIESWKKNKVLDILLTKFHHVEKSERNYYLNLYIQVKNRKVIRFGVLSKLISFISIIGIFYQIIFLF